MNFVLPPAPCLARLTKLTYFAGAPVVAISPNLCKSKFFSSVNNIGIRRLWIDFKFVLVSLYLISDRFSKYIKGLLDTAIDFSLTHNDLGTVCLCGDYVRLVPHSF